MRITTTKIIVVSRADVRRIHTLRMLDAAKMDYTVVVHDRAAVHRLREAGVQGDIVESGTKTLVEKRNWILDHLVKRGEWFIGMDDNIQHFTCAGIENHGFYYAQDKVATDGPPPNGKTWRKIFNAPVTPQVWLQKMVLNIAKAHEIGAPLVGVATMENPFFRARHYSNYRFVKTKVFAMRNERNLGFKHEMCHDSYLSALAVKLYGRVLVDSFLHYKCKMYEEGGLGNRAEREKKGLIEQMQDICSEFPGLVSVGKGANTALRFRLVTEKGVEAWRVSHK